MPITEKSKANLKPKKFQKGNKAAQGYGRPPKLHTIEGLIRDVVSPDDWRRIIEAVKQRAIKGNPEAANMLMDRVYGKPTATIVVAPAPVINVTHSVITVEDAKRIEPSRVDLNEY